MLAMVGLVAVVLVIAGAGSLILTRNAARNQAESQLVSEVNSLTSSKIGSESLRVLEVVRTTLKLEDADVIQIDRLGNVVTPLPENLTPEDIDVAAVQSGQTTSGARATPSTRWLRSLSEQELARRGSPARCVRGHVRHPPHPRHRRPRAELALLHRRRRRGAARRRPGGVADEPAHGAAAGRGDGGDRAHRGRRADEPGAGPARRLPRVRLSRRLHQRHGAEPGGGPRPRAPPPPGRLARPADAAHLHPRLCRGHSGRGHRGQRRRRPT